MTSNDSELKPADGWTILHRVKIQLSHTGKADVAHSIERAEMLLKAEFSTRLIESQGSDQVLGELVSAIWPMFEETGDYEITVDVNSDDIYEISMTDDRYNKMHAALIAAEAHLQEKEGG